MVWRFWKKNMWKREKYKATSSTLLSYYSPSAEIPEYSSHAGGNIPQFVLEIDLPPIRKKWI